MSPSPRTKVIYDTDPGVDDAMALYYALAHPAIDVVGITTTFGNVSVEQATTNALYLTALAGRDIPVSRGVATPWFKHPEAPPAHIHGADGLGNLGARRPAGQQADPRSSAQFIVDMARAHPGEITLVAVGPLGNLSLALQLEPQLPNLVREVIVMGGTVSEPGNVSPVAEANIWNDPHAADRVFTAGWRSRWSGWTSPTGWSCCCRCSRTSPTTTGIRPPTPCTMRWSSTPASTVACTSTSPPPPAVSRMICWPLCT
jgi:inosine-uridine nucleoside N-ribohydrolase